MNIQRADGKLVYRAEPFRNYYGDLVTPPDVVLAEGDSGIAPRKEASENCESGKRDYCTCDVCF